jgi:hypothetical protein
MNSSLLSPTEINATDKLVLSVLLEKGMSRFNAFLSHAKNKNISISQLLESLVRLRKLNYIITQPENPELFSEENFNVTTSGWATIAPSKIENVKFLIASI